MTALAVRSAGAVTAAGPDLAQTMGAIEARFQLYGDTAVDGANGEPITGAFTPLDAGLTVVERVAALARVALAECAAAGGVTAPLPLIVCAPAAADLEAGEQELLERLLVDSALAIDRARTRVVARGHDAVVEALGLARQLVASRQAAGCYVVGADSLIPARRLKALLKRREVLDGVNPDGFIPGEGAAALLLLPPPDGPSMALIAGVGSARDAEAAAAGAATGRAIGLALEQALADAGVPAKQITRLAHDLSGSYSLSEELALAVARPPLVSMRDLRVVQPAVAVGEIGAAAGVLSLAALAFLMQRATVPAAAAALFTAASGLRGAAVLYHEARAGKRR